MIVAPTAFFRPIVIYGCLLSDGVVELVSVTHDEEHWKLIGEDPLD